LFNSWFHFRILSEFFRKEISGAIFGKPFTYRKGEIILPVISNSEYKNLHFSVNPPLPMLNIEKTTPTPKKKVHIFPKIEGKHISEILIHKIDRQILIKFSDSTFLLFQLFGIAGNIIHFNREFEILTVFKKRKSSEIPLLQDFNHGKISEPLAKDFNRVVENNRDRNINFIFSKLSIPIFSKTLILEICQRAKLDIKSALNIMPPDQISELYNKYLEIILETSKPCFRIYGKEPGIFSIIPLNTNMEKYQEYTNIVDLTDGYLTSYYKWKSTFDKRNSLLKKIEKYILNLERKLKNQQKELSDFPTMDSCRETGDILMANLYKLKKGQQEIKLKKILSPDEEITIKMDKKLSPAENAEKYYKKARKLTDSRKKLVQSIKNIQENIESSKAIKRKIISAQLFRELKTIETSMPAAISQKKKSGFEDKRLPYITIFIGKWELRVGRSAQDNDVLTHKKTNSSDFWFHAQNVSGSHVIVRNPQRVDVLPKDIIAKAAGIAAYKSKSKHSSVVSVIYTMKKYVWKPKNSHPGTAACKYEKSIIIEPLDPRCFIEDSGQPD